MPGTFTRIGWAALLASQLVSARPVFQGVVRSSESELNDQYDYVVVGSGAGGLVVANRLSEDHNVSVLLIEAGDFHQQEDYIEIPGLQPMGDIIGTKYDWNLTWAASGDVNGRAIPVPQGKMVGGTTTFNRMNLDRGFAHDYNNWEALGNKGWNWDNLLPYFKKNEKFTPPSKEFTEEWGIPVQPKFHGDSGYMHSIYSPWFWPTQKNMIAAVRELGLPFAKDQANGFPHGAYWCPHDQSPVDFKKCCARDSWWDSVSRDNFHLIAGRTVTRVITETEKDAVTATGVEFAASATAKRSIIRAKKEVILAAGAIFTPQVLQVSGIGDPKHLKQIGVKPVVNLPAVGYNLHDHPLIRITNDINAPVQYKNLTNNATFFEEAKAQFAKGTGPLTSPGGDFLVYLQLSDFSKNQESIVRDARGQNYKTFLPVNAPKEVIKGYKAQHELLTEVLESKKTAILEVLWDDSSFSLGLEQPFSRGNVMAASASMFDHPIADVGYMRNPVDVQVGIDAVLLSRRIIDTEAISSLDPTEVAPGRNITTRGQLEEWVRNTVAPFHHPVGTTPMMPREIGGVVDPELKVYGVENLRVVDAGVIPLIPATHIQQSIHAIAERATDLITAKI